MNQIHWILQSNLIKESVFNQIKKTFIENNISFEEVKIIPFSDDLPEIKTFNEINVFYGSTTLILNAYKKFGITKGIFYDHSNFNLANYIKHWSDNMLNYDSKILTFEQITKLNLKPDSHWFIRPIEDDKSFSGKIMSVNEIYNFEKELLNSNNPYLTTETLVGISSVKEIEKEWRLFIIDKQIISICRYTMNGELSISDEDIPDQLIKFTEECLKIYAPAAVFVMDIALYKNSFKIVECNCFNDSGFYKHNIEDIILKVNQYLSK
ncbi:MAG: ATP-grasp domain-containing protein [Limnohabitans sp.]|nr:ATP-grasp domain-containing protein [Limnohabitans sp.]